MEVIELLRMCQKNYVTVKKAFSKYGIINIRDARKPFKELTEEEVFAYIMNWIVHQMRGPEQVTVRFKVEHTTYEMKFRYIRGQLRVNVPKVVSTNTTFMLYDWTEADTLNELTVEKVNASVQRANVKNIQVRREAAELQQAIWTSPESCLNSAEHAQIMAEILDV